MAAGGEPGCVYTGGLAEGKSAARRFGDGRRGDDAAAAPHATAASPRHFGGVDGPLGRYYMGHLSGKIANILFDDPDSIDDLDFKLDEGGAYYRRRLMLTAEAQSQIMVF